MARRLTSYEDPLGRLTAFDYDTLNRQVETTLADPDGAGDLESPVYQTAYDWLNRVTQLIDPHGNFTQYDYFQSEFGFDVRTRYNYPDINGFVHPWRYDSREAYDPMGNIRGSLKGWDSENNYSSFIAVRLSYNGFGSSYWFSSDGVTPISTRYSETHDAVGRLIESQDSYNATTVYVYDDRDRLIAVQQKATPTSGVYAETEYEYDDAGQLLSVTDALGHVTTFEYDALGRLVLRTDPDPDGEGGDDPPETSFTYDAASRLTSVTDPLGHTTEYEYDAHDNVITMIAEDTGETAMTFDDLGNMLTLTDPEGNTTTWTYDALYRVIEEENESEDSRYFEYDDASRLVRKTDRNGRVIEYEYDHRNQLTAEIWKEGESTVRTLSFGYDLNGALTYASDPAATFTFTVDGLGRPRQEVHDLAGLTPNIKLVRTLDAEGRQTELKTYFDTTADLKNTYTFDAFSRLTSVKQEGFGGNTVAEKRVNFAYCHRALKTVLPHCW